MPNLEAVLEPAKNKAKRNKKNEMTAEEMLTQVKSLNAMFGGEVK